VRELKNALERAVIMSRGNTIAAADVIPRYPQHVGAVAPLTIDVGNTTVAEARKLLVLRTLAQTGGDVDRTAKLLGLSSQEVQRELSALLNGHGGAGGASHASVPKAGGAEKEKVKSKSAPPPKGKKK
jgi:DNA-binding NtrC family response regulator